MIEFFKNFLGGLKKASLGKKIIFLSFLLIYLISIVFVTVKVNVEIITPGGVNFYVTSNKDLKDKITVYIESNNDVGEILTVGVYTHKQISLFQYLISLLDKDITHLDFNPKTGLSKSEEVKIGIKSKDQSIINAIIAAYNLASQKDPSITIDYKYEGLLVTNVSSYSKSQLQVDDVITHFNGIKVEDYEHFKLLNSEIKNDNTVIKLTVIRDGKTKEINARKTLEEVTNTYVLGISIFERYVINEEKTYPKFAISKNSPSIGGSGGAMIALAIYDALTEGDITNGKRIIGTGTIDVNGKVGSIDGVAQKVVTAQNYHADIFFVHVDDYQEAVKKATEINAKFPVIRVEYLHEIISELEGVSNG